MIKRLFRNPQLSDVDLHDPDTVAVRGRILESNPFLKRIYREWYAEIAGNLPGVKGPVVELGTGAGFLDEYVPGLITTDILWENSFQAAVDGEFLPFRNGTVRAIILVNVFHHFARPRRFLDEARRCLMSGGRVLCIEPWVSAWSRPIFRFLHHEPFEPSATQWESKPNGPLAGGNNALPWIVFHRDREVFEREYPELEISTIHPIMPVRYLASGGLAFRSLVPYLGYGVIALFEKILTKSFPSSAMFAAISVKKRYS